MVGLTVGRWDLGYFPDGETVRAEQAIGNLRPAEDRLLAHHERLRRILVELLPGRPLGYFFLHWSDGTDLEALDSRVREGTVTAEEMSGALLGEAQSMACGGCGAQLRVVVASPGIPIFPDDAHRLRTHTYRTTCPVCGTPWTASVLEIISVDTADRT